MTADQRPLYQQVIDKIKQGIRQRAYQEGEMLPTEFELSKQLGVSRTTVKEALRILEKEGEVIRRHGVGTFVHTKPLFRAGIEELHSVTDMIANENLVPGTIFLSSSVIEATKEERRLFQSAELERLFEIERVRTADGLPIVYCLDQVPNHFVENRSIHETKSIFRFLESINRKITYAVADIEPVGYHEHISEILECEPGTSLLLLKQVHYDQEERPVLYSLNYFRADKFKFHLVRKRVQE